MIRSALLLAVLALFSGSSWAQEMLLGYVNVGRLMEQAPQAEAASRALEKEFSQRGDKLAAERDSLRQMQERLEREGEIMAADRRAELERDFRNRTREFRRAQEIFNEDLNLRRNEEIGRLQRQIQAIIIETAREDGIDLVVADNVLYASERIDITPKILDRLHKAQADR